ncbi:MAG: hypothetical protein P8I91_09930 [Phycisphaerales bacterium]|nr:hypothetical protein [Phycisphaerales bacterium]
MNRTIKLTPLLVLASLLTATNTTNAERSGKHTPGRSTPWQLHFGPLLHTNQDGVKRSIFDPSNPWADLSSDDSRLGGPSQTFVDLVTQTAFGKVWIAWPNAISPVDLGSHGLGPIGIGGQSSSPEPTASPVPGAGTLALLGLASLTGRRRRR